LFEFSSDALGAQSGVGGGGRYDRLIGELGGPPTPGMGFAAGVERILLAGAEQPIAPAPVDLLVIRGDRESGAVATQAFELSREARVAGLAAQLELAGRSLKSALKHADRIGARYVAIVTGGGQASLKDMTGGEQQELAVAAVIATLLRGSRL
ncbi:MAG: His/Gly/Thr/Pro-type tRNA ligase C-terminal domain-containing protein, partial [Solirubrobacteraceae bacterium]